MNTTFRTHTGEIIIGNRLNEVLNQLADEKISKAYRMRKEHYATHVTEDQKDIFLMKNLNYAEQIRKGKHLDNLGVWQAINYILTGQCVPLLS